MLTTFTPNEFVRLAVLLCTISSAACSNSARRDGGAGADGDPAPPCGGVVAASSMSVTSAEITTLPADRCRVITHEGS